MAAPETVAIAATMTPDNRTLCFEQKLSVGNVCIVTVTIPDSETEELFLEGGTYILTGKLKGTITADPFGRWTLARVTDRTATTTMDLRLTALYTAIGTDNSTPAQFGVEETTAGPMAAQTLARATDLWQRVARDGDTAPAYASENTYTDAEVDAKDTALQSQITPNTTHRSSDGTDHANVALNDTHRTSDGKDHSDVVLNNAHRVADVTHASTTLRDAADSHPATAITPASVATLPATPIEGMRYLLTAIDATAGAGKGTYLYRDSYWRAIGEPAAYTVETGAAYTLPDVFGTVVHITLTEALALTAPTGASGTSFRTIHDITTYGLTLPAGLLYDLDTAPDIAGLCGLVWTEVGGSWLVQAYVSEAE